jgi:hypothetical protein
LGGRDDISGILALATHVNKSKIAYF